MNVTVNGKVQTIGTIKPSVSDLLKSNKVENENMVTVQVNGEFVNKQNFSSTVVNENDEIDFIYFMGGGSI